MLTTVAPAVSASCFNSSNDSSVDHDCLGPPVSTATKIAFSGFAADFEPAVCFCIIFSIVKTILAKFISTASDKENGPCSWHIYSSCSSIPAIKANEKLDFAKSGPITPIAAIASYLPFLRAE